MTSADGIFGPLTQAAVINYQRANGLAPDGIVGPLTWENLMRRCAGGGIMPFAQAAESEAPVPEAPQILSEPPRGVEYSAFDLGYIPTTITPASPEPECEPAPPITMTELLMYFMLRDTTK